MKDRLEVCSMPSLKCSFHLAVQLDIYTVADAAKDAIRPTRQIWGPRLENDTVDPVDLGLVLGLVPLHES